jgi:hypothetical protein
VSRSLPADTVCAGNPALVICGLDEYLEKHRARVSAVPTVEYSSTTAPEAIKAVVQGGDAYVTGGRSAGLRGEGGTPGTHPAPVDGTPGFEAKR